MPGSNFARFEEVKVPVSNSADFFQKSAPWRILEYWEGGGGVRNNKTDVTYAAGQHVISHKAPIHNTHPTYEDTLHIDPIHHHLTRSQEIRWRSIQGVMSWMGNRKGNLQNKEMLPNTISVSFELERK